MKSINIETKEWFDKTYGNSYFSSKIIIKIDGETSIHRIPFQYGYGRHSEDVANKKIKAILNLPELSRHFLENYELNGFHYNYTKQEGCRKKDVEKWGISS